MKPDNGAIHGYERAKQWESRCAYSYSTANTVNVAPENTRGGRKYLPTIIAATLHRIISIGDCIANPCRGIST